MTQQRYHTRHYDSLSAPQDSSSLPQGHTGHPTSRSSSARSASRDSRTHTLPGFVEPGPQAGDVSTLRFLASRKLRQFDVEGPSPLSLSLNGRPLGVLRPGQNAFEPPIPLSAGDVLQLEVLAEDEGQDGSRLTGWNTEADTQQPGKSR